MNREKEAFNQTFFTFSIPLPKDAKVPFESKGYVKFTPYYAFPNSEFQSSWKNKEFTFQIDKIDSVSKYISGCFSGPIIAKEDPSQSVTIENGFFDVEYLYDKME